MSRKELKILNSVTFYFVSGFRRNYNNGLLKLAPSIERTKICCSISSSERPHQIKRTLALFLIDNALSALYDHTPKSGITRHGMIEQQELFILIFQKRKAKEKKWTSKTYGKY
jgi:hypothetical protein